MAFQSELADLRDLIQKISERVEKSEEDTQDLQIHVNLLTRLLTTLCIEKFGMRVGVLKRLIKRIESEAVRDSQILHLETLYRLSPNFQKKNAPPTSSSKNEPWEEIS
jgi:hypothetical protein